MSSLPFLPGNTFSDPTKSNYHVTQTLGFNNGYTIPKQPVTVGKGGIRITHNQLNEAELFELSKVKPHLTYGQTQKDPQQKFIPSYVFYDKKVLRFEGYYRKTVHESSTENSKIIFVSIFYYLEDDTISVIEKEIENSGAPPGKLLKRQRLPKDNFGNHWHWKDLNVDITVTFYGKVFHMTECDKFTKEWLISQGIDVNDAVDGPDNPYASLRKTTENAGTRSHVTPSDFDKLKQFLEMDRKVLRFFAVWDDRSSSQGSMRPFVIQYYLVDNTMEIREVHKPNDGYDPFPVQLRRSRVPIDRDDIDASFPLCTMEPNENEIKEYFTSRDLCLGRTVVIYNRKYFLYNWDGFTCNYYKSLFPGCADQLPIDVEVKQREFPVPELPPWNGFGSLEDSMQSCLSLIPQPPKKDFIKLLQNDGVVLRFLADIVDEDRTVIINYRLADDTVMIFEPAQRNAGSMSGKFLEATRVPKFCTNVDRPEFLGPQDFYIGADVHINSYVFRVKDADDFVLTYLEEHQCRFPGIEKTLESLRELKGKK